MPEFKPTTMIGVAVVLGMVVLGALGFLTNPKPQPAPSGSADATRTAVEKAGAKIMPTVNQ